MKIIDLLNKIAKDEEVPRKIKFDDEEYTLGYGNTYQDKNGKYLVGGRYNNLILNDEVEIIEEEKEIPIYNIDNMKIAGEKAGEVYRRLYEGFKKGWNAPIEEEKEIEKIDDYFRGEIWTNDIGQKRLDDNFDIFANKINELIDVINDMRDKE